MSPEAAATFEARNMASRAKIVAMRLAAETALLETFVLASEESQPDLRSSATTFYIRVLRACVSLGEGGVVGWGGVRTSLNAGVGVGCSFMEVGRRWGGGGIRREV